jgi:glyoxylase-like metal-dependent hydrolase (beta-lactamase superfamily II)
MIFLERRQLGLIYAPEVWKMSSLHPPGIYPLMQRQGIFVHAFLIDSGNADEGLILIDTLYSTDAKIILDEIQRIGKTPKDLRHIMLTHAHRAHMGGLAALKSASGARVYCHPWEVDIVEGDRRIQNTTLKPMYPIAIWPFQVASRFSTYPPCKVDQMLRDGSKVGPLEVIYTPGHTPGHLAFTWPERSALFAGDALVNWPKFDVGWAGFMLNARQNRASIRRLAELNPNWIGVGHGDPVTSGGAAMLKELAQSLPKD